MRLDWLEGLFIKDAQRNKFHLGDKISIRMFSKSSLRLPRWLKGVLFFI